MNVLTLQREVFKPALYLPAVVLSAALVLGVLLIEITLNQGLAIVFGITILTIWQYDIGSEIPRLLTNWLQVHI